MSTTGEGMSEDDMLVAPEDPTNISATSPVDTVEQAPVPVDLPVTDIEMSEATVVPEDVEPPVEFDPQYRQAFEGLLFIGKVTKQFKWLGHSFTLKTPTIEQMLEAGQLHKPYVGTVGDIKAWQSLMLAASIASVDGKPLPVPFTDETTELQQKFEYINRHWYPWTTDALYEQYILLDAEVAGVIDAMGKA